MRTEICMKLKCKDCKNYNYCFRDEAENINERRDLIYKSMQKNFINQNNGKSAERLI